MIELHEAPRCNWKGEWKPRTLTWEALLEKLRNPKRTGETIKQYMAMSKEDKLRAKDKGGFVAGRLKDNHRGKGSVEAKSLITLDADYASETFWEDFKTKFPNIQSAIYSTHSHTPEKPRYRLIVSLQRELSISEYEIASRYIAATVGVEQFDDKTYEPERLMFWPSVANDGEYIVDHQEGWPFDFSAVPVEWYDATNWPISQRLTKSREKSKAQMGDPLTKRGAIGAFCRLYDIPTAIENYLSDIYVGGPDRYTYTAGSSSNGLVVYDNGLFAFSHHATDPAGLREVNAWDLVRLHLFRDLDDGIDRDNTPISDWPSQKAMEDMARNTPDIIAEMVRANNEEAGDIDERAMTADNWRGLLRTDRSGVVSNERRNIFVILMRDPAIAGALRINQLTRQIDKAKPLPWSEDLRWNQKNDTEEFLMYLERYGQFSDDKVKGVLTMVAGRQAYHPVADYLTSLTWDGVRRAERLLIDCAGATDSEYTMAVTKAWLLGAVKRAMEPGSTMQYMLLLSGPQGIGKSTFLRTLATQPKWFSDRVHKMDASKEAVEALTGKWIIEVGELAAMKKGIDEQEAIKAFLSSDSDYYRTPYATYPEDVPRSCVFAGTSNDLELLRDATGGRRFWPVRVSNFSRNIPVDQIWAEAMTWYVLGEEPYLQPELEAEASRIREGYQETDANTGRIEMFLDTLIPEDYEDRTIEQRQEWWNLGAKEGTKKRIMVCGLEIHCVLFGNRPHPFPVREQRSVSNCLRSIKGWEQQEKQEYIKLYGKQRIFKRI